MLRFPFLFSRRFHVLIIVLFVISLVLSVSSVHAQDDIWIEGESPSSVIPATIKPEINDDGKPDYLSGGKWLKLQVDAQDVAKEVPDTGVILSYKFTAPERANYEVWNRLGFENVRSPFDWRVDEGSWNHVDPMDVSTDLVELQTWNPLGWVDMGSVTIDKGEHTLFVRILKDKDSKGNYQRILYASDAICLYPGVWRPNDLYKPGDMSYLTPQDKQAALQVFDLSPQQGANQTSTSLKGLWRIARWDEPIIKDKDDPATNIPDVASLYWKSMEVPGDRNSQLPMWMYGHRYILRTRVRIPEEMQGRSFILHLPSINMLGSVFVNGELCGTCDTPFALWNCDITKAVKPGRVNDILLVMKDAWYALQTTQTPQGPTLAYMPQNLISKYGPSTFDFPVWNHYESGILQKPSLIVAGKVYVSDVFPIPSVTNKTLELDITLHNSTNAPITVQVNNEVVPLDGVEVAKIFAPKEITVPANGDSLLKTTDTWANPHLWWPDDPFQYDVVTTVTVNGKPLDRRKTKFGFRQWGWKGASFTLNGVSWWGCGDLTDYSTDNPDKAMATLKAHGQDMMRLWGENGWGGMSTHRALDYFDAHGMCIRRTGIFDGEMAAYNLTDAQGKPYEPLFRNWRKQLLAWAKGQRNHPSIFIWSIENEITFINAHVFGNDAKIDPEIGKAAEELMAMDPTRPVMTDGGNALLDQSLPVYGGHYMEPAFTDLPQGAYDEAAFAHRQVWPVTEVKPILLGESYYATGTKLSEFAAVGGEMAMEGWSEARPAVGLVAKMLSEGYRWNGINFQFWMGGQSDLYYNSWQPIAVLCKEWNWTFDSGERVTRRLGIFNNTHYPQPIHLIAKLVLGNRVFSTLSSLHQLPAGGSQKFDVILQMPKVASRTEAQWLLTLEVKGKQVFRDVKYVSILDTRAMRVRVTPGRLAVYDPEGAVIRYLRSVGVTFAKLENLNSLPANAKVLLIGANALDARLSDSSLFAAYTQSGHSVIFLEQKDPLRYQGLPGVMPPARNQGYIAFSQDLESPLMHGLKQKDLFTWGGGGLLYRDAYEKPVTGGDSLIECGEGLAYSAVARMTVGKGMLLLSQLLVERKLDDCAPARALLLNLIRYGLEYRKVIRPVEVSAADNPLLVGALRESGLRYASVNDPLEALSKADSILVTDASPSNLHLLATHLAQVNRFVQNGGWIVFNNLTPKGLQDFNRLVGFDHMIRPFGREKVTWCVPRNPLTSGLSTSDIVMNSGQRIFSWMAGDYPDPNEFSYVLDYDDVAPFGKSSYFGWANLVNGFTMNDGYWPLIENIPIPKDGKPFDIPIVFPKPLTFTQFTFVSDTNYWGTTKVELIFNGKTELTFNTVPGNDPQTFAINPPQTGQNVTLRIAGWEPKPGAAPNMGLDNIYLMVKRPPGFHKRVRPMLNIGAMLEYPRGKGGMVLCNVKFMANEAVPENAVKKRTILAVILRNLGAPFSGGKTIIAGAKGLIYHPVDISKKANQYRNDKGWFGDRSFTFADLPTGIHTFAGVTYNVYEFTTSPVPDCIMLGGANVPGNLAVQVTDIPVNRKATALFFLQAARIDQPLSDRERKEGKRYEMADYIIHYADGQIAKVPIYSEIDVDNYRQERPAAIPGAQIAWVSPYAGTKYSAVAYSMQWNNPRPNVEIQSVDIVYGPDRRGVLALLALTAATTQ